MSLSHDWTFQSPPLPHFHYPPLLPPNLQLYSLVILSALLQLPTGKRLCEKEQPY